MKQLKQERHHHHQETMRKWGEKEGGERWHDGMEVHNNIYAPRKGTLENGRYKKNQLHSEDVTVSIELCRILHQFDHSLNIDEYCYIWPQRFVCTCVCLCCACVYVRASVPVCPQCISEFLEKCISVFKQLFLPLLPPSPCHFLSWIRYYLSFHMTLVTLKL